MALAPAGMPQLPVTVNVLTKLAARAGPPSGPGGLRVSATRQGVTVKNRVEAGVTPVVIRPILLLRHSVNHMFPSGPAAIPIGPLLAVGMGNSVMTPAGVIR